MTRRTLTDAERIVGLREVIEAARGDWHEATALLSVCADLHWLLARSESPSPAEGLDVETLQYALEAVDPVAFALDGTAAATREQVGHFRYAHAVAAEYARLRSSADSGTEGT